MSGPSTAVLSGTVPVTVDDADTAGLTVEAWQLASIGRDRSLGAYCGRQRAFTTGTPDGCWASGFCA